MDCEQLDDENDRRSFMTLSHGVDFDQDYAHAWTPAEDFERNYIPLLVTGFVLLLVITFAACVVCVGLVWISKKLKL